MTLKTKKVADPWSKNFTTTPHLELMLNLGMLNLLPKMNEIDFLSFSNYQKYSNNYSVTVHLFVGVRIQ